VSVLNVAFPTGNLQNILQHTVGTNVTSVSTGSLIKRFPDIEKLKQKSLPQPDLLIPASLDVDGLSGLAARLNAGANVVTSIVPPEKGLAGVANHSLDIEDSRRTLTHILPILKTCGLETAQPEDYRAWIKNRQHALLCSPGNKESKRC